MTTNGSTNQPAIVRIDWADFILTHGDSMKLGETIEDVLVANKLPRVLISFKDIQTLGSSSLGMLVHSHNRLKQAGGKLCLCELTGNLKLLMRLTKLDATLNIKATMDEAMAFLNQV